jgi:hypothetical protein
MHGRDLLRRHVAIALLLALPLCFYFASQKAGRDAVPSGGIGMAFAVSGAALFSAISSLPVDQRLILSGYRPGELLVGRLLFLGPLGLVIAAAFAALMSAVSHPEQPVLLGVAIGVVALQSVPFGLAVAAIAPRELEGTLVVIGVVGMQMATRGQGVVAKILPFYGPRRLITTAVDGSGAVAGPLLQTAAYGVGLLILARLFMARRLVVRRRVPVAAGLAAVASVALFTGCGSGSGNVVNRPATSVPSGEVSSAAPSTAGSSGVSSAASSRTGAGPQIVISPNTGLGARQAVRITGRGFTPGERLQVIQCADKGRATGPGDCNLAGMLSASADASGAVQATLTVLRGPFGSAGIVCSAAQACLVSVTQASLNPSEEADAPISFAAP